MSYMLQHTAEAIDRKLYLVDENKNLLPYPYDTNTTFPAGLEDVGDGSFLTSAVNGASASERLLNTCSLIAGKKYIISLDVTNIKEEVVTNSGFALRIDIEGKEPITATNSAILDLSSETGILNSTTGLYEVAAEAYLLIPTDFAADLLIKPQIEEGEEKTAWVPYMKTIGTYVDERFNGTNAKIKVLADKFENVDEQFTISGTVTKEIGGIAKDTSYDNAAIIDVLTDLLFPYVAPIMTSITLSEAAGTFEYGTTKTVSKVTPNFTKGSKNITSIKIGTTEGGSDLYSGTSAVSGTAITLTTSKTYDGNTNGTIYCTISDGTETAKASASISYQYYDYAILSTSTTAPTSGATKQSKSGADNTYSYSSGQYLWLYSRSSNKKIQQYISGTWSDVNTFGGSSITLTLENGSTATYYAYRTDMFTASGSARYKLI